MVLVTGPRHTLRIWARFLIGDQDFTCAQDQCLGVSFLLMPCGVGAYASDQGLGQPSLRPAPWSAPFRSAPQKGVMGLPASTCPGRYLGLNQATTPMPLETGPGSAGSAGFGVCRTDTHSGPVNRCRNGEGG